MNLKQSFLAFLESDEMSDVVSNVRQISDKLTLFTYKEINFVYVFREDDSNYFQLLVPKIEDYSEQVNDKLLDFSKRYKIAKAVVIKDSVWFSFEQIVLNITEGDFQLYKIAIRVLLAMVREWKASESQGS